jgi:hypothetical protein
MHNINNFVSAIIKGDKQTSSKGFEVVMREKINAALDAKKVAIADSVFNGKK